MSGPPGFFDAEERLRAPSAASDPLERLAAAVDPELFRAELAAARRRSARAKGGRPPYHPVLMFRVLILQTLYTLFDEQTEYQLKDRDRLSFMRFAGLALHDRRQRRRWVGRDHDLAVPRAARPGWRDRAAVRPEAAARLGRQDRRPRPGQGQDRARQLGLQPDPLRLASGSNLTLGTLGWRRR